MSMSFSPKNPSQEWLRSVGGFTLLAIAGAARAQAAAPASEIAAADDAPQVEVAQANIAVSDAAAASGAIETVIVTAQRRAEKIQDVPSSITALSGADLTDDGIGRSSSEVLKFIPNASAGTIGHGRPRWWIRGVGTGTQGLDSPSPVGLYLDDVYIDNASATGFPLFDLDRVEVLRGPQGTLWGKNTTGGAIDFISKKPTFTPDGYAKIDYGSYNDKIFEGAGGGAIADDWLAARASFHYEDRDGPFDNLHTGDDEGGGRDAAGRIQFLARVTPNLDALLNVHFRNYRLDGNSATVVSGRSDGEYYRNDTAGVSYTPSTDRGDVNSNAPTQGETTQNGAALTLNWQLGELALTSISAYEAFDATTFGDGDNTPLELSRTYADQRSEQLSQELRLASPSSDRLNWVGGLHYFTTHISSDSVTATLPSQINQRGAYADTSYSYHDDSLAAFGNATFDVTDAFKLNGGLRWTTESKDIDLLRVGNPAGGTVTFSDPAEWWRTGSISSPLETKAVQDSDDNWNDWTYDFTPSYKFGDDVLVYARYAKGFRSGGYNSSATQQAGINVLKPETLTSYEIGAKTSWLDNRLIANASVFHYVYDDIQINVVTTLNGAPNSQLVNAKRGLGDGAELEFTARPVRKLLLKLSGGYLDARFDDFPVSTSANGSTSVNYKDNTFVRSPKWSGVFNAEYTQPLSGGDSLIFGTDWNATSRYYFFVNDQTNPNLQQGGYATGTVRLSYVTAADKVTITAYVNNVTDAQYKNHTLPGTTAGATTNSGAYVGGYAGNGIVYWSEPRTYGLSLTTRW
jgi:iron complex outermembrane receptor protein